MFKELLYLKMERDGASCDGALGNNRPEPQHPPKRVNPSKYWHFTVYKHTVDEIVQQMEHGTAYIIGNEICPKTGRKHLQCFLKAQVRIRPMEKYNFQAHWGRMESNVEKSVRYCAKDGEYVQSGFGDILKYMTENEIISLASKLPGGRKDVSSFLYKGMFITKRIKPIKCPKKQKEYVDYLKDMVFPLDNFNWAPADPKKFKDLSFLK